MHLRSAQLRKLVVAAGIVPLGVFYGFGAVSAGASPTADPGPGHGNGTFEVRQILSGTALHHSFTPAGTMVDKTEPLSDPDDITRLGGDLFVGFQNGVGPQGQASSDGNLDSTVVELTLTGHPVAQWDVLGKTDGVTADPDTGTVIATVDEDLNSALYVIDPGAPQSTAVTRYAYNDNPLPHNGGTDAISIYHRAIFISASAPGTVGPAAPQASYPAVYLVTLNPGTKVATVAPVFFDEATATVAKVGSPQFGKTTQLALTDPDSNEVVPHDGPRFAGDFMLTSQGDMEQIYLNPYTASPSPTLSVLSLSQSVDDTAWPTDPSGSLYSTDSTNDAVDVVTGPFSDGQPLVVATPCGANGAPSTCPAPNFPANFLASLNPWTGQVSAVSISGAPYVPQGGLAFVSGRGHGHWNGGGR
jgi:hypothetical protein